MPSLAVAMVVAMEKNIEKKCTKLKFHETSKKKSHFQKIDFFITFEGES